MITILSQLFFYHYKVMIEKKKLLFQKTFNSQKVYHSKGIHRKYVMVLIVVSVVLEFLFETLPTEPYHWYNIKTYPNKGANMEKTLVLIKPDAVERNLIGKILAQYEENNLKITRLEMIHAKKSVAEEHYVEHLGRPYYEKLIQQITQSPLVALVLEGEDAINRVRQINGKTNPLEAEKGTVRALYGIDTSNNTVHASDSLLNAQRETNIWFK